MLRPLSLVLVLACLVLAIALRAQSALSPALLSTSSPPGSAPGTMTTAEHLRQPGWWPTRALPDQDGYVGTRSCATCHGDIAATQQTSQMARTLGQAANSAVLHTHLQGEYRSGPYTSTLHQSGKQITVSVTDGTQSLSAPLGWSFGSGDVGQSYLWQKDGAFYESRFNYFSSAGGFAATPGRLHGPPISLEMALGRQVAPFEARSCFSCHTTAMTSAAPLNVASLVPGITCEACHGPGAAHAAAMQTKPPGDDLRIFNPGTLSPAQSVDFCGACHSSPWDVRLMGAAGLATVRFPAYRLEKSRCWGAAGDERVTCIACHDPHQPLARQAARYDPACLSCHQASVHARADANHPGAACPVATKNCASCHMPKYELPEMHYKFTDHMIRIARKDAPFPD